MESFLWSVVFLGSCLNSIASSTNTDDKWSAVVNGCIKDHNNEQLSVSTIEECMLLCEQATQYQCLSIETTDLSSCALSQHSSKTLPAEYTQPCYADNGDHVYLERDPAGGDISSTFI